MAGVVAQMKTMSRDLDAVCASVVRIRDGLARVAPVVEARRAARVADAKYQARAERCTPAAVQAANEARWGRGA